MQKELQVETKALPNIYILGRNECRHDIAGAKAANLARLHQLGYSVPPWFVIAPAAFYASLTEEQLKRLEATNEFHELQDLVGSVRLSDVLKEQIEANLSMISKARRFAVRSSALDEDGAKHSFAGQLESVLSVEFEDVAAAVVKVWRSAFSSRITAYRELNRLSALPKAPAVIVQEMIEPDFAGVAFSVDPVTCSSSTALVCSTVGCGDQLVSGEVDGNTYHVDLDGTISNRQVTQIAPSDESISLVALTVRELARQLNAPQDIEWALSSNKLYMLQARPITSIPAADSSEPIDFNVPSKSESTPITIWDNSNIGESYPGVTTPLTFSFARKAYENVYLTFCQFMGVSTKYIAANQHIFPNMIGLLNGRIYYNLVNWYRLLSILPGYRSNKQFMEQMMGLKEPLPAYATVGIAQEEAHGLGHLTDTLSLVGSFAGVGFNYFTLPKQMCDFNERFDEAVNSVPRDLSNHSVHELASLYRDLERKLLRHWDAPLTNDFFAMIFYGLLRKLTESLATKNERCVGLYNDLLCGQSGIVSTEPTRMMQEMAQVAKADADLVESLLVGDLTAIARAISNSPQFECLYMEYLEKFGDRCLEELKLESMTLYDNPLPLLRNVGHLAKRELQLPARRKFDPTFVIRESAESLVISALKTQPARLAVYRFVLKEARERVRDRENLRFKRTRLFGCVRRIFKAFGTRFRQLGLIGSVDDVFYLEVEEILGLVEGTSSSTSIRETIAARKGEFARYRNEPALPTRVETSGLPHLTVEKLSASRKESETGSGSNTGTASGSKSLGNGTGTDRTNDAAIKLRGLGCCAGTIKAPVRVVVDPRTAEPLDGEILIAERTDPGWIMLFGQAVGIVVEHGSLLSHTAIVARELGIPAAVSVAGVMTTLKTGDWIELNGSTGEITTVDPPKQLARIPSSSSSSNSSASVIRMHLHPDGERAHA